MVGCWEVRIKFQGLETVHVHDFLGQEVHGRSKVLLGGPKTKAPQSGEAAQVHSVIAGPASVFVVP